MSKASENYTKRYAQFNKMKSLLTTLSIIVSLHSFSQSDTSSFIPSRISPFTIAVDGDHSKLYLKKSSSKKTIRVKEGATSFIKTKKDTSGAYIKILMFNDSGIFISPYQQKVLSETDQGIQYNLEYQVLDSIKFIKYSQITGFSFRNNLKAKVLKNYLTFTIGISMFIAPPIAYGLDEKKSLFSEPSNSILMGIGAILTTYSIYKFKRNIKLKQIDLSEYSFNYTLQ